MEGQAGGAVEELAAATAALGIDSSLPLWFKPERFLEPEFSPEAYVNDLKRYVPLETLRGELQQHLEALKNRLVEVINEDYNDFVSLSTKLVNVDGAVLRMQKPLEELQERLEAARSGVAAQAAALQDGLQRRQEVAAARALLELMQDTAHVMSKVEKLLGEMPKPAAAAAAAAEAAPAGQGSGSGGSGKAEEESPEALEASCRLLDRVGNEVSRLQFYAARGQELEFMRQLQPRITAAVEQLQAALDVALAATLRTQSPVALGICLHAYAAIGSPQAGESAVRTSLVAPVVQRVLREHRSKSPLAGATGGGGLGDVLGAITTGLQEQCGPFLEHTLSQPSVSQSFDFLGGAVLADVLAELERSLPGVFSAGVPSHFHANFRAAYAFLDSLEAYCTTAAQVEQFRSSQAYSAFVKKWNLPVYFSLRFQDIAGGLESALSAPSLEPAAASGSKGGPSFNCAPTAAVWTALQRCAAADVFLPQLGDRFVRLAMQLLARYASWIRAGLAQRAEAAAAAGAGGNGAPGGAALPPSQQQQQQQQQQSGTGAGGAEGAAIGEVPGGWAAAASPEQLAALWQDAEALSGAVLSTFVPQLSSLLGALAPEAAEAAAAGLQEGTEGVQAAAGGLLQAVAETLTEKCVVVLKQLRGIVATFRMTNRSQPTRPSHYAATILGPLQQFTKGDAAGRLSADAKALLAGAVVEQVSARYQQLADDTLSTVRKTESSLKRLKTRQRGAEGGDPAGAAAPDTDKMIAQQLQLDIQAFGRQAKGEGVDVEALEPFRQLCQTVAAPEAAPGAAGEAAPAAPAAAAPAAAGAAAP